MEPKKMAYKKPRTLIQLINIENIHYVLAICLLILSTAVGYLDSSYDN